MMKHGLDVGRGKKRGRKGRDLDRFIFVSVFNFLIFFLFFFCCCCSCCCHGIILITFLFLFPIF